MSLKYSAIEAKADDKLPTAIQARELEKINNVGGIGIYVNGDNVHKLKECLEGFKR